MIIACIGLAGACTPIASVHREQTDREGQASKSSTGDAGITDAGSSDSTAHDGGVESAAMGGPCAVEGQRSCAGAASRARLICQNGSWNELGQCAEDERCQNAQGPEHGRCLVIAPECMNRKPGVAFCDADQQRRVCPDLVSSEIQPCAELEHCVERGASVSCDCIPGTVADAQGCHTPVSCDNHNGGCDPLTHCSQSGGQLTCDDCPPGYSGTGTTGCAPLAAAIELSTGALSPAFDPAIHTYRATVPFVAALVSVSVSAPKNTLLEVNGVTDLVLDTPVPISLKPNGDSTVEIVLRSSVDISSKYQITLQRAPIAEHDLLKASNAGRADTFGYSVAMTDQTLAVGAIFESAAGAVYVFDHEGDDWVQKQILRAPSPVAGECFGTSLAIYGDTLAVGALNDDPCLPTASRGGVVYLFRRDGGMWIPAGQVTGPGGGAPKDGFGSSVSLGQDLLAVGAMYADQPATNAGAAHVFARSGDTWALQQTLSAEHPAADAQFGIVVALQDSTLVASAWQEGTSVSGAGAAYVFTSAAGHWTQQARLQATTPEANAGFGYAIALLNDRLVISAPHSDQNASYTPRGQVIVFERRAGNWTELVTLQGPNARDHDEFGLSVGLSKQFIAVGSPGDSSGSVGVNGDPTRTDSDSSGALHLFSLQDASDWKPASFIKASNADRGDNLGCAIAMSDTEIIVSANAEASSGPGRASDNSTPNSGAVYVFH